MARFLKPFKLALRGFVVAVGSNIILQASCALASNKLLIDSWLQKKKIIDFGGVINAV